MLAKGPTDLSPCLYRGSLNQITESVPSGFERTPEEDELVSQYGLDDEQLMFRRRKIAQNGIDRFKQEYPANPNEAFLSTGRPVFNPEQLQELLTETRDVEQRLALEGDEFVNNPRGELSQLTDHTTQEKDMSLGLIVAWASEMGTTECRTSSRQ